MKITNYVLRLIKVTDYNNKIKLENNINTKYEDLFGKKCVLKHIVSFDTKKGLFVLFLEGKRTGLLTSNIEEINITNSNLILKTLNSIYYFSIEDNNLTYEEEIRLKNSLEKITRIL